MGEKTLIDLLDRTTFEKLFGKVKEKTVDQGNEIPATANSYFSEREAVQAIAITEGYLPVFSEYS